MQDWEVDATGNALKSHKRHCRGCACSASIFNMYFASVLNSAVSCTRICCASASRLSRIIHTCTFLNINSWHTLFFPDCLSVLVELSTPEEAAAVMLCKWGEWGLEDDVSEIHSSQQRRDQDTTRHDTSYTIKSSQGDVKSKCCVVPVVWSNLNLARSKSHSFSVVILRPREECTPG